MGVIPNKQNVITRCNLGQFALNNDNMYAAWYRRFVLLFGALGLITIAASWLKSDLSTTRQIVITATVLALLGWFWFFGQWHLVTSDFHAALYLLGNILGIVILIRTWDGTSLLLFAIYWFGFAYLYTRYALIYALILTISTQWAFGAFDSNMGLNVDTFASVGVLVVILGFSGMMARYIEAFQNEAEKSRHLLAELKRAQESLINREREAGVEQERRRMAGEIHDTIAQHFASIITNLRAAREQEISDPALMQQHVANAFAAAQQGLTDSRSMLATMQPDVLLGRSLTDVLTSVVEEWSAPQPGINVTLSSEGEPATLSRAQESLLVRATQEALRNIGKHAGATSVDVRISWLEDEMLLDITDNGIGFTPAHVEAGKNGYQLGLATMESRVEAAGGTFALESAPGEGVSITISFPTGGDA